MFSFFSFLIWNQVYFQFAARPSTNYKIPCNQQILKGWGDLQKTKLSKVVAYYKKSRFPC